MNAFAWFIIGVMVGGLVVTFLNAIDSGSDDGDEL